MVTEFYLKKPNEEQDYVLNAICDGMNLTRNLITDDDLMLTDDFCGDLDEMAPQHKLITSLKNNIETPSIYTLYFFEHLGSDYDDSDDDEVNIQVLAVVTFSISVEDENAIKIITLCSNQSRLGGNIEGSGKIIITFLFNAVQEYVNQSNKEMDILLTPVKSAIGFYKKVGMKMLSNRDMIKEFTPMVVPLQIYGNSEFNELSESNNYVDIIHYIVSQGGPDSDMPRMLLNKIWKENKRNPRVQALFDKMQIMSENGIISPKYKKYYAVFLSKNTARGITKRKRNRQSKKRRKRLTRKN